MSQMLDRFVKIIEQVDPDSEGKKQSTKQHRHHHHQKKLKPQKQEEQQRLHDEEVEREQKNKLGEEEEEQKNQDNNNHLLHHSHSHTINFEEEKRLQAGIFDGAEDLDQLRNPDSSGESSYSSSSESSSNSSFSERNQERENQQQGVEREEEEEEGTSNVNMTSSSKSTSSTNPENNNSSSSSSTVVVVPPEQVKQLLQRIASMEASLVQAQHERQQLQCKLEEVKSTSGNENNQEEKEGNNDDEEALREALVEQVEKCANLSRDFQGRVVQLEYELLVSKQEKQKAQEQLQKQEEVEKNLGQVAIDIEDGSPPLITPSRQLLGSSSLTLSETGAATAKKKQEEELEQTYATKVLEVQRKSDRLQKIAADALGRAAARERVIQQDLEHAQSELAEQRQRVSELQRPLEDQLESQLRKTPVFSKIESSGLSSVGNALTSFITRIDRVGVSSGRFLSGHALVRVVFVFYILLLHLWVFHLFASALHGLDATSENVHDHLEKHGHLHGHHHKS